LERLSLYNLAGDYETALSLIEARKFHPWEGGEGKVSYQYLLSLVQLAKDFIQQKQYEKAIAYLEKAQTYPHNLGEGKLYGAQENDIDYWLGCAYAGLNKQETASGYFIKATRGLSEPSAAIFYNDQQPDKIFYQGLAHKGLGNNELANTIFNKLVAYGIEHADDKVTLDYFAVSLPNLLIFDDDLDLRNRIHAYFIQGLGYLGLERTEEATQMFNKVIELDATHSGSKVHLEMAKELRF
jgi:tetratricopeptide (TPR) repeat protein